MHAYRSHTCGALRSRDAGSTVRLSGWIHRKRDHGGLMFIDLRDHYGLTQLVLSPETPGFQTAERARAESVIRIDGEVLKRSAETVNPNLPTGEIEIRVKALDVLGEAAELPVPVFGEPDYPGGAAAEVPLPRPAPREPAPQHHPALERDLLDPPPHGRERFSPSSRRRSSPRLRPKARGTSWCRAGCTRASSTRSPRPRSSSSSC